MSRPAPLERAALDAARAELGAWTVEDGKLHRELRFADFSEAWGFMTRVALVAEQLDHHPEWSNVWATVVIDLVTHDANGITELDVAFARRVDAIASAPPAARPGG
ncbi:MAG: 4a-hydroxytetrahydrobiopterin dehydratase [Acidimicrobiia bacterium]|nr:4a-hydroxytetrahydrobiopterin dehydratase [Acidimicrobiia bacterium]